MTTTRRQGQQEEEGDALGREEQEEFLLRERSMAAMEQRVLAALRGEVRRDQQEQALSSTAPVPSSVTKALFRISALKEKEFEVWLSHVDDA